jgi:signal transduction histidine kinase
MAEKGGVLRCVVQVPLDTGQAVPVRSALVRVVDSGPGIPEEIRHRIFNPFFSTKPQGSGLGLAWTRKVIDAHGGVLDLESRSGRGATFTIRLPLPNLAAAPGIVPAGDFLHEAQDSGR